MRQALQPIIESDITQMKEWTRDQIETATRVHVASNNEFQTIFAEADADGDKLLNLAEYLTFAAKYKEVKESRGEALPTRTDE